MYIPRHFAAPDQAAVHDLLTRAGTLDLVTAGPDGLAATTLPFVFDPRRGDHGALVAHVARNNDQWRAEGAEALAIVRGPEAYVSPSWYATKREHGRVVPTWNYVTVHVHGRLHAHHDPAWIQDAVRRLTDKHEADRPEPWRVDDAPDTFLAGQVRAIVGVEVVVSRIEAKWKLSQNRPSRDVAGVIEGLRAEGARESEVAEAMEAVWDREEGARPR
ncbi:FMN-binding negative transcriptional regulator [Marinactinospora thermotolerans]|uniref:Negative transcriptional regulator, PaiB family n=1 Tax=Marinactinospora thermotolerans DSM 45154 TaxID=1122192 RepID=A0A1T4JX49_9ACTN|nr:FMN-binding negative transcriptional regulator [Marinactinospora thermotolerans]SJZ34729.1 negative transcriptional regulator, PaiB family [Marinactinospora thermotolerans DSM 45154]